MRRLQSETGPTWSIILIFEEFSMAHLPGRPRIGISVLFTAGALIAAIAPLACSGRREPSLDPEAAGLPVCETGFLNSELLSNLTENSVTLSVFPARDAEMYVEFGPPEAGFPSRTSLLKIEADHPGVFRLEGLTPDSTYEYRLRCRNGSGTVGARPRFRFRTLGPEDTVTFAFATDSHIFSFWTRAECGDNQENLRSFSRTLENVLSSDPDFLIIGGDSSMTHCPRCLPCKTGGEDTGAFSASALREAELRYRVTRNLYETVTHSVPVFRVLGNHEGEAGFSVPACGHNAELAAISEAARLKYFPVVVNRFGGGSTGNYLAFEAGPALFIILDVMRYTSVPPERPEDWTLSRVQLDWLEAVLKQSQKAWKFVFAEHLVGGSDIRSCGYQYGRGGVRSTVDGRSSGEFRGEQSIIHNLMKRHGAQFFFYGHDHVFAFAEKLDRERRGEGIYYVCGGRTSGLAQPRVEWFSYGEEFESVYDLDEDGTPDFLREPGFTKVTTEGERRVRVQYILTDYQNPEENGKVLFERTIESDAFDRTRASGGSWAADPVFTTRSFQSP
jgi:hypothetical protein